MYGANEAWRKRSAERLAGWLAGRRGGSIETKTDRQFNPVPTVCPCAAAAEQCCACYYGGATTPGESPLASMTLIKTHKGLK